MNMECYSGTHVIEALVLGGGLALIGTVVYYKRFSQWTKQLRDKL